MYLGLGVEEVFALFSILIGASIYATFPPPTARLFDALPPSASTWVLKYIFTLLWFGIKGKLGMKEEFNFHFILDPSVTKRCKGNSVDIDSLCS